MPKKPAELSATALNIATAELLVQLLLALQNGGAAGNAVPGAPSPKSTRLSPDEVDKILAATKYELEARRERTEDAARDFLDHVWSRLQEARDETTGTR